MPLFLLKKSDGPEIDDKAINKSLGPVFGTKALVMLNAFDYSYFYELRIQGKR